mmetsp:Transcript_99659/g.281292  ORF Transcript_99659/g.281292 Transcript_99659/m.281292 type:complete len:218 (+) Transcript_99659:68-721(+)
MQLKPVQRACEACPRTHARTAGLLKVTYPSVKVLFGPSMRARGPPSSRVPHRPLLLGLVLEPAEDLEAESLGLVPATLLATLELHTNARVHDGVPRYLRCREFPQKRQNSGLSALRAVVDSGPLQSFTNLDDLGLALLLLLLTQLHLHPTQLLLHAPVVGRDALRLEQLLVGAVEVFVLGEQYLRAQQLGACQARATFLEPGAMRFRLSEIAVCGGN